MTALDTAVSRRFTVADEAGKIRLVSHRDELLIEVADSAQALEAFSASPFVTGERAVAGNAEVDAFFRRHLQSWEAARPGDLLVVEHRGPAAYALAEHLRSLLVRPRDIRDYNAAMFRVFGEAPVRIVVFDAADAAPEPVADLVLPVRVSGRGAVVGPFLHARSACYACVERGLAMQGFRAEAASPSNGAVLLASRVLDSLLSRPFVPYVDDVLAFSSSLDVRPALYQALRMPRCERCDAAYARFPKRFNRYDNKRVRAVLRQKGLIDG